LHTETGNAIISVRPNDTRPRALLFYDFAFSLDLLPTSILLAPASYPPCLRLSSLRRPREISPFSAVGISAGIIAVKASVIAISSRRGRNYFAERNGKSPSLRPNRVA